LSTSIFSVRSSATYGAVGDISFGITTIPTSNNTDVSITYESNNTNVATIHPTTGIITPVGFGTTTFTANQTAVTNKYVAASITSNQLSVARGTTTLSRVFMNSTITKTFGFDNSTFDISANSASSGAVTYYSSDTSCASIDINTGIVTLNAPGQTIITAKQAQSIKYNAPLDISSVLLVIRGTTSFTRVSFDISINKTYGDPSFNVIVSSASSGAKTYISSDASCATIDNSSGRVTIVSPGSTILTISQAETSQFYSPADISAVLIVDRNTPLLTRTSFPSTITKYYLDAAFSVQATSSNTQVNVSYASSVPSVATIDSSSGNVTILAVGTTTITASQTDNANYTVPTPLTLTLDVLRINTVLTGFPTDLSKNIIEIPFTITATSDSSGVITYESTNTSLATINSSTGLVSLKGVGTVTLLAKQAQSTIYNAPNNVSCILIISAAANALVGQVISPTQSFAGVDLSGASLAGATLSSVSFTGANLSGVNFTGAIITNTNFTGADITGANIDNITFSPLQKLQLLKNVNNREIGGVQIQDVSASDVIAMIPQDSPILSIPNVETLTFKVVIPQTATSPSATIENAEISNTSNAFYMPINESEYFKINNVKYYIDGTNVKNASTGSTVSVMATAGNFYKVFAGSLAGVALDLNTYTINNAGMGDILTSNFSPIYITDISRGIIIGASRYNYTNNSFRIPYSDWDFDTYEYDIDFEITTNYTPGDSPSWNSMFWCVNSDDASGSRYYNTYQDILSTGFEDSGVNNSAYVHNLRSNNKIIQHYCKMKIYKVSRNFTGSYSGQSPKLVLESTDISTALNAFTSTDVTNSWSGYSLNTYMNTTSYNNTTLDLYVDGSNWTTYSQCYYRLRRRLR
jgi:hypothetical protein